MLTERVAGLGCDWISMDCDLFTGDMPAIMHQGGFKLGVWTVDTLQAMRRFVDAGADSLTSNRPDLFAELAS